MIAAGGVGGGGGAAPTIEVIMQERRLGAFFEITPSTSEQVIMAGLRYATLADGPAFLGAGAGYFVGPGETAFFAEAGFSQRFAGPLHILAFGRGVYLPGDPGLLGAMLGIGFAAMF